MSGRSDSRSETPRSSENQPDDDKQEVSLLNVEYWQKIREL